MDEIPKNIIFVIGSIVSGCGTLLVFYLRATFHSEIWEKELEREYMYTEDCPRDQSHRFGHFSKNSSYNLKH